MSGQFAHLKKGIPVWRWRTYFLAFLLLYAVLFALVTKVVVFKSDGAASRIQRYRMVPSSQSFTAISNDTSSSLLSEILLPINLTPFSYHMLCVGNNLLSASQEVLVVEGVLPAQGMASLQERVSLTNPAKSVILFQKSLLLMWDTSFHQSNLRGCPDWNCEISSERALLEKADAVFFQSPSFTLHHRPDQYFVHYSQESPVNSYPMVGSPKGYFNLSLGFRHGTLAASPYGYTVKLAEESRRNESFMQEIEAAVQRKSKSIAWFVSHCSTASKRESVIDVLKKFVQVDVYGLCGPLKCPKGNECQDKINSEYFFYFAAENSICTDYITEKLWNQGFAYLVVPIVLRRKIVERYVPPNSFIAVDDFPTIQEMAIHLSRVMKDRKEYLKYFNWRQDYETVILDNRQHPTAERAWGFCQVCRLTQMEPRPIAIIENMEEFWDKSCERTGEFVDEFLRRSSIAGYPDSNLSLANRAQSVQLVSLVPDQVDVQQGSITSLWNGITAAEIEKEPE